MTFESKNAQIKRFVSSSFRNVPLTVAIHHQQWICHQLATHPIQTVSNFFYSGDVIISGRYKEQCSIGQSTMFILIHIHVGAVTEVHEHVEEILSLCGEASVSGKESLELLKCVCMHAHVHPLSIV